MGKCFTDTVHKVFREKKKKKIALKTSPATVEEKGPFVQDPGQGMETAPLSHQDTFPLLLFPVLVHGLQFSLNSYAANSGLWVQAIKYYLP